MHTSVKRYVDAPFLHFTQRVNARAQKIAHDRSIVYRKLFILNGKVSKQWQHSLKSCHKTMLRFLLVLLWMVKPLLQIQYFCDCDKRVSGDLLKWFCVRRLCMSAALTLHEALSDLHLNSPNNSWKRTHLKHEWLQWPLIDPPAMMPYCIYNTQNGLVLQS